MVTRYRAARPALVRLEPLDEGLIAAFHRASGITHLLAEPAPELLAMLADRWLTAGDLRARLAERFDVADENDALAARLDELVAAGLIEAAPA